MNVCTDMSPFLPRFAYCYTLMPPAHHPKCNNLMPPFLFLCNILRKKWVMKLIFCMQINIKVSYQLILKGDTINIMDMVKHSQSTWNNKFAIPSQYLKKEVRDGVHFLHANKHQSFCKLAISFLMEVARHVESTLKRRLVIVSIATVFETDRSK